MTKNSTYGVSVSGIRDAIAGNRKAIAYWTASTFLTKDKRDEIIADQKANVRDLQIMLMHVRFPESTLPVTYAEDFTPVIETTPDVATPEDVETFISAIVDHVESVTGETVNA